jgi:hypothetical protein
LAQQASLNEDLTPHVVLFIMDAISILMNVVEVGNDGMKINLKPSDSGAANHWR